MDIKKEVKNFKKAIKDAGIPYVGTSEMFVPDGVTTPHLHIGDNYVGFKHKKGASSNFIADGNLYFGKAAKVDDHVNAYPLTGDAVHRALGIYKEIFCND